MKSQPTIRFFILAGMATFLLTPRSQAFQKYTRWVESRTSGVYECKYIFSTPTAIESRRVIWDSRRGSGQDFFLNYYKGNKCTARCACKRHPNYVPGFEQWARPNASARSGFDAVSVNPNDPRRFTPQVPSGPDGARENVVPPPAPPGL